MMVYRWRMARLTPPDYELAGVLHRQCRANGENIKKLMSCLIAAIAIRQELPLLHQDDDFKVLERHTELKLTQLVVR